jgi:hypothetical protein
MMDFILFSIGLDSNGFHIIFFDFVKYGGLIRIAVDIDRRFFGLHLLGLDLIYIKPQMS